MNFGPGLFCVTNSPGPYHGTISGSSVTFYLIPTNFGIKFNGGGTLSASAPTIGTYAGVLIFSAPQTSGGVLQDNQSIGFYGNGTGIVPSGSIILPSGTVTMFGNSSTSGYDTQIIAYNVDTGGNSDITINYNSGKTYQAAYPAMVTLLK